MDLKHLRTFAVAAEHYGFTRAASQLQITPAAASSVPSEFLVPELLSRFRERYPRVRESLSVSDRGVACLAMLEGDADVAFIGELPPSK